MFEEKLMAEEGLERTENELIHMVSQSRLIQKNSSDSWKNWRWLSLVMEEVILWRR